MRNFDRSPHIVIIGAGFGGLKAAQSLSHLPVRITLIDKTNHHLFQPLLYQVATAGLSPGEIASPIRSVVHSKKNIEVIMGTVTSVETEKKTIHLDSAVLKYDFLILATGVETNYFGHENWRNFIYPLKNLSDALKIRENILLALEFAELESDPLRQNEFLTFVMIGGGPTGVEMAGAIAELTRRALTKDFRKINKKTARIFLVERGPRILNQFSPLLAMKAAKDLEKLGIEIRTNSAVVDIKEGEIIFADQSIKAKTMIWTAGVKATPAAEWLGIKADETGRMLVDEYLRVKNLSDVFAIGDLARFDDAKGLPLPQLAPVAIQQGKYLRSLFREILANRTPTRAFRYSDKGNLATIGRSMAIAEIAGLKLSGLIAWLLWTVVHLIYLINFRNRIFVLSEWIWSYVTYERGARLIIGRKFKGRESSENHL